MKKFVSMLLVSTMLLTALTACDNKANNSDSNPSSSSTATNSGDSSTDSGASAGDSSSDTESSTSDNESSSAEDSASTPDDSSTDPDISGDSSDNESSEPEGVDNSGLPFPDNKAGNMTKTALATDNWPAMDVVSDPETISIMISPDFDVDTLEEYCFTSNFISGQLNRVIVLKPKAESEADVSATLDAYFETVTTDPNIVFYPAQEESAAGAVKGKTDDGYYYIIVHQNGADIESAMLAAV